VARRVHTLRKTQRLIPVCPHKIIFIVGGQYPPVVVPDEWEKNSFRKTTENPGLFLKRSVSVRWARRIFRGASVYSSLYHLMRLSIERNTIWLREAQAEKTSAAVSAPEKRTTAVREARCALSNVSSNVITAQRSTSLRCCRYRAWRDACRCIKALLLKCISPHCSAVSVWDGRGYERLVIPPGSSSSHSRENENR